MYLRFAKVFYFICVVLFIVAFLYIYASLPEQLSYEADGARDQLSKGLFFSIALGLFVVLNLVTVLPAKMLENQSFPRFRRLLRVGDPFRDKMLAWIFSFCGLLNINLFIMAYYVFMINNPERTEMGGMAAVFYLAPLLYLVWIVGLFVLLVKRFKQFQSPGLL